MTDEVSNCTATDEQKFRSAQRGRTVDQLKRLYGVLMAFATTACVNNAFNCAKLTGYEWRIFVPLGCQALTFVLMIAPTYFIAEYYLDYKYLLKPDDTKKLRVVLFDLGATIPLAILFLILSQGFPLDQLKSVSALAGSGYKASLVDRIIGEGQITFFWALLVLNVWDLLVMLGGIAGGAHKGIGGGEISPAGIDVRTLCVCSLLSIPIPVFFLIATYGGQPAPLPVFIVLLGWHILRFFLEMLAVQRAIV
ncbi:MAG: hypothetical protein EON59_01240 [Alphaproteobacteria bacterium]|nr:MAG: hypothetical protein EON59_01240 [Alphaproteobacteria bacterium]